MIKLTVEVVPEIFFYNRTQTAYDLMLEEFVHSYCRSFVVLYLEIPVEDSTSYVYVIDDYMGENYGSRDTD